MTGEMRTFVKKTHGSVAHLRLMFLYLLPRLALKDGKIDIGDRLFQQEQFPLGSLPAFLLIFPFEP